jgi:regulator of telomere elongation helicase 1
MKSVKRVGGPRRVSTSPSSSSLALAPQGLGATGTGRKTWGGGGGGGGGGGMVRPRKQRTSNPTSPPTTIELRGIPIHFPFRPYKCQEDYMTKVLDALLKSENALLESPTGTGKTLCLLCATLAWQREQVRLLHQSPADRQLLAQLPTSDEPTGGSILTAGSQTLSHAGGGGGGMSTTGTSTTPLRRTTPTIIYASRTHSQLSQVVRELRNTRYRPKHAVLGSREQMCANPKVKKATSTASEVNHDCNKLGKERKCRFRNNLEGFQPPPMESGSNGTQPVMDMEDLISMGNTHKVCPFYYTRSLVEDAELILVPYNYLFDKDARKTTLADIPWNNAVVIFDEAHNLEAFASESASFDLSNVDIAGCIKEMDRAMAYVQADPNLKGSNNGDNVKEENMIKLKSIFINLEEHLLLRLSNQTAYLGEFMMDIFRQGASITHANHVLFIAEVQKVMDIFMEVSGGSNTRGAPRLEHFVQCLKRVYGEPTEARCLAKAQSYRVYVSPKTSPSSSYENQGNPKFGNGGNKNRSSNFGNNNSNTTASRTVSYWCFAPAEAMRDLANLNARSILVTSGTLSPLESYAMELGLPFPNRLENPHIISNDQIHVRVVGKGVSGKNLCSSYERRKDHEYYMELGSTLVSLSKVTPHGMLVFFPSYSVMETCLEKWGGPASSSSSSGPKDGKGPHQFFAARQRKSVPGSSGTNRYSFPFSANTMYSASKEVQTPWKRLLATKAIVVEPKSTTELADAIAEFHKFLAMPKSTGCFLFGVCRGKISEGIDFAHDMCRAVVITGTYRYSVARGRYEAIHGGVL